MKAQKTPWHVQMQKQVDGDDDGTQVWGDFPMNLDTLEELQRDQEQLQQQQQVVGMCKRSAV